MTKVAAVLTVLLALLVLLSFLIAVQDTANGEGGGVLDILAYSEPIYGEDFVVFEVLVSGQDVYPECTLIVDFDVDGLVDETTRVMPTTHIRYRRYGILNPNAPTPHLADPAVLTLVCAGIIESIHSEGNTLPYQARVEKIVITTPPTATDEPTQEEPPTQVVPPTPEPTPTDEPTVAPTATSVPPTATPVPEPTVAATPTKPGKGNGRK